MNIGIKSVSFLLSKARCPNYKKDDEEKWIRRTRRHDRIRDSVIEKIKSIYGNNIQCITECKISVPLYFRNLGGSVDAICWNEDNIILIEVKSYPITRCSSQDVLQLILYKQAIIENPDTIEDTDPQVVEFKNFLRRILSNRSNINNLIKPYLVYRDNDQVNRDKLVIIDLSKYNLIYSRIEDYISAYDHSVQNVQRDKKYLIGFGCFTCSNTSCPFRPIR